MINFYVKQKMCINSLSTIGLIRDSIWKYTCAQFDLFVLFLSLTGHFNPKLYVHIIMAELTY